MVVKNLLRCCKMPITSGFSVMDEIRNHFAEIEHHAVRNGRIYVTFSCGIASYPKFQHAKILSDAADNAMYHAKAAGRNQVIIVSGV